MADRPAANGKSKIGHTFSAYPYSTMFYGVASQDGQLFQIDLQTLGVGNKLTLKATSNPLQGIFDWNI